MILGIAGLGTVGGALKKWLEKNTPHKIMCYDPPLNMNDSFEGCHAVFICVPVPTLCTGKQDLSLVQESIDRCDEEATIFIRSTVLPGTSDSLGVEFLPEFLTERFAASEMERLPVITTKHRASLVKDIFPGKEIIELTSNKELELAKFTHNCFGALKVTYFNLIKELCEIHNLNYQNILKATFSTGFVTPTYTKVPGPDGEFGYGGKCFPENIEAFKRMTAPFDLIEAVSNDNSYFRNKEPLGN